MHCISMATFQRFLACKTPHLFGVPRKNRARIVLFFLPHPSLVPQTSEPARMLNTFKNETHKDPLIQNKDIKEKYTDASVSNFSIYIII